MNKTSTKTLITLLIVLISFIFIVEFTSPIQSINIGHLQKRQDPAPSPDKPPPKDDPPPPPPPKDDPPPPPPPKDNPPPPPKDNPPQESPPPPKDNPSPAPQPAPETTPDPNPTPDPNATPPPSVSTPPSDPIATSTPDPNATPPSSPSSPAPNPNVTPTPDPNAPTPNPTTTVVSDTTSNTVSPIVDSSVVTSPSGTSNADPNPNTGVSSISPTVSKPTNTTSYPPGREPCTKADDTRCGRRPTDPTVVSTTEENEIITQPLTTPAEPTKSQSQLAPNPKKSTITQFTTYTTTSTMYFPGYSTVTSSKGPDGELTTYATYIPPSTVVVVKKVTSAKIEEIQETNPSSAGHLDLELSVYNLYSIATSLFVIAATMLYLIVA